MVAMQGEEDVAVTERVTFDHLGRSEVDRYERRQVRRALVADPELATHDRSPAVAADEECGFHRLDATAREMLDA